ncbi:MULTISPECIES: hypothetical protein [unclassified Mesorhizobium]|uniref:hypothetical protein n=1 Tax=unclassified Mesorhizobium TaxID=325217 RepID=UPI000FD3994F|nr:MULTISPECIES: hypothetical protein [unclassified Mesorhizobium]RVB72142.1 hypothetical protein EN885_30315 [Mesorhizobium sp. M6A.T.Cr.TU.014.01.1.1]RWP95324.1 MAG: hypothetical protein EOR90_31890 [Mesorhizobium sp.]RWP96294.1 MAG: hypothetical protein EOR91_31285 [Mesorhizobium sp.]
MEIKTHTDFPLLGSIAHRLAGADAIPNHASLTPEETAEFLTANGMPIAEQTLAKWRCLRSDGPRFRKVGRYVLYTAGDLRTFLGISIAA